MLVKGCGNIPIPGSGMFFFPSHGVFQPPAHRSLGPHARLPARLELTFLWLGEAYNAPCRMADRVPRSPQFIDRFAVIRATIAVGADEDHQVLPGAGIAQETLYPARMV